MKNILVVGSINMDMVMNTPYIPKLGETINGLGFMTVCGGKGANQACAIARLGLDVSMIGCVGDDVYASTLKDNLTESGVEISGIHTVEGSSGVAQITVCDGNNFIILEKGANGLLSPEILDKEEEKFRNAYIVILQFEIPEETNIYAAKLAKKHNAKVLLNPAPMQKIPQELLKYVDIFVPNRHEAAELLGYKLECEADYIKAICEIRAMGIGQVVITLGSKGSVFNKGDEIYLQPPVKTNVVDTTAAGDSFIGGFSSKYTEGCELFDCITNATKISTIVIGKKGASTSIPSKEEVEGTQFDIPEMVKLK